MSAQIIDNRYVFETWTDTPAPPLSPLAYLFAAVEIRSSQPPRRGRRGLVTLSSYVYLQASSAVRRFRG